MACGGRSAARGRAGTPAQFLLIICTTGEDHTADNSRAGDQGVSPLPPGVSHMHNVAMFLFVLVAILLLVLFWQYFLAGLGIWVLVLVMRAMINWTVADPRPSYPRKPVQTRPVAKLKPARELPAPDYLPRWTASRRLDAGREHAQWQTKFDNAAQ